MMALKRATFEKVNDCPARYKIVQKQTATDLIYVVNQLLADGYELQGGVSIVPNREGAGMIFYQAMVKP